MLQESGHINLVTIYTIDLIFRHVQCLHLMNSEVAWVLLFLESQV